MSISIITPHFNDFEGIKQTHSCLLKQDSGQWEWIIVDDFSDLAVRESLKEYFKQHQSSKIQLIFNDKKTNASVCRNVGVDKALHDHIVFLDADDTVSSDFVANRRINFTDFAVFQNYAVVDKHGSAEVSKAVESNYLNYYLSARFIWQTTTILWDKSFFNAIGQFNNQLPRLQDVELSIRALQQSTSYAILDNPVDFYYNVRPIRERKNLLKPVCEAVYLFISEILNTKNLNRQQILLLSSYYYLCVKYLERSGQRVNVSLVQRNLTLFYKKRYIGLLNYSFGFVVLKLFNWNMLSPNIFLRINRRIFKPSVKY
jgi:glycosyltransferase involved in cell wall biosynthesis